MADYRATSTEFTAVADAIRTKGGTSAQLTWPNGFVSAVQAIPSGSAVIQPLSVTQNDTYNPPSGVDGYAPITVNVSGGGSLSYGLPNSVAQDIIAEADAQQYSDNDTAWGGFTLVNPAKFHKFSGRYVYNEVTGAAVKTLTESNQSFTAYLVASCNQPISTSYGRYICSFYANSAGNMIAIVTHNGYIGWTRWGSDAVYSVPSNIQDPHVICLAVDSDTRIMHHYIDGVKYGDIQYSNSGDNVSFFAQQNSSEGLAAMTGYMAVVDGCESEATIIANSQYLMSVLQTV